MAYVSGIFKDHVYCASSTDLASSKVDLASKCAGKVVGIYFSGKLFFIFFLYF